MAENDVFIEGGNWPDWATEATLNGLLRTSNLGTKLSGEANNLLRAILQSVSNKEVNARMIAEAKRQASAAEKAARAQEIIASNSGKQPKQDSGVSVSDKLNKKQLDEMGALRGIISGILTRTMPLNQQQRFYDRMLEAQEESNDILSDLKQAGVRDNMATRTVAGGFEAFKGLTEGFGMGGGNLLGNIASGNFSASNALGVGAGAVAGLYGAAQGGRQFALGQIEGRYDLATEMRQSGLLSAMGEVQKSFHEIARTVNGSNFTLQEAAEFTRQFGHSVGVIGVTESMKFVDTMANGMGLMDEYGASFAQVATISGTYLDTLERVGMLETISARQRDRGMVSFMDAVQSTSQVLKVSMEDAAKMISEYLGRDDISAMIMTAAGGLSEEMQIQIGQMGNMGPLGEIIAMGAIDPQRFMLTDEYQQLMNPALSGVRGIIEQMQSELAAGGNTSEITARYSQQLSDIVRNDPLVRQLVAMDDEVATLVAGIGRFAQTAEDAVTRPDFDAANLETDNLVRQRQELERLRDVTFENVISEQLKTQELYELMQSEIALAQSQIDLIQESGDALGGLISGVLVDSVSLMNDATTMLFNGASSLLNLISNYTGDTQASDAYGEMIRGETRDRIDSDFSQFFGRMNDPMNQDELIAYLTDPENATLFSDQNARMYAISKNLEMQGGVSEEEQFKAAVGMPTTDRYVTVNISRHLDQITTDNLDRFSELLSNTMLSFTENAIFSVDDDNNVIQLLDRELRIAEEVMQDVRSQSRLTDEEITNLVESIVENMQSRRSQEDISNTQKSDIDRLISTIQGLINDLN